MRSICLFLTALAFIFFPTAGFAQQSDFNEIMQKYEKISSGYKQFKFGMSQEEVEVVIKHLYPTVQIERKAAPVGPDLIFPHTIKFTDLDSTHYVSSVGQKSVYLLLEGQEAGAPAVFYLLDNKLVYLMMELNGQSGTHKDFYDGIKEKYSGQKYILDGNRNGASAHAMFGRNDDNVVWAETAFDRSNEVVDISYCEPAFYDASKEAAEQAANQQAEAKRSLID